MSTLTFCIARRKAEQPAFLRVLKAVPQDRLDFRPDPKARSAAALAWLLAYEEAALLELVETGTVAWKEPAPPVRVDEIVAAYERDSSAVTVLLERLDEGAWQKRVSFLIPGAPAWEDTLAEFVWGFLFDAIHHRGQLATYLRPMGSKVPQIYGPSADDPGQ